MSSQVGNILNSSSLLEDNINEVESTVTTLQTTASTLNTDITALESSVTTLQGTISTLDTDVTTLETNITSLQTTTTNLDTDITVLEGSVATLQTTTTALDIDITALEANVLTLETTTTNLDTDITALEGSVTALQALTTNNDTDITTLEGDVTALQSLTTTQGSNITTLQGDVSTLQTTTATMQTEIDANTTLLSGVNNDNTFLGVNVVPNRTTGNNNVVIGENAGEALTTGNSNVFIGEGVAPLCTSNNNVVIGRNAGLGLTTRARCICIGMDSSDGYSIPNANTIIISTKSGTPLIHARQGNNTNSRYWAPGDDNATRLGHPSRRWAEIFAGSGTINTSDGNLKTSVIPLNLGLNFVNAVEPKSYHFKDRHFDHTYDEDGNILVVGEDNTFGRAHYGFIAQDIKQAIIDSGEDPLLAGVWCEDELEANPNDPDLPTTDEGLRKIQGIRHDELVPILWKAVQELSARVQVLEGL